MCTLSRKPQAGGYVLRFNRDERRAQHLTWDGARLEEAGLDPQGAMLTTSSHRPEAARPARQADFERLVGSMHTATAAQLWAFHRHQGADAAAGLLMSRPDACTHSISRITVSRSRGDVEPEHCTSRTWLSSQAIEA